MKKALRKNFYMEIRHSLGRFLSIFFIVAIGCAFFSGIRASEPDMRYSGDAYFDEKNLMDIQVMSTMGQKMIWMQFVLWMVYWMQKEAMQQMYFVRFGETR